MARSGESVRILVIRSWTAPITALRQGLRAAKLDVRISRIDIEPALDAVLTRSVYDVIVFDPTSGIPREVVEARLREHGQTTPILSWQEDHHALVEAIQRALIQHAN